MRVVIGFSGPARSGKDTAAEVAIERFGFRKEAFADPLREMALGLDPIIDWNDHGAVRYSDMLDAHGYDEAKKHPEVRQFLQRLGTDAVRTVLGTSTWVDHWQARVEAAGPDARIVATDVRFDNEAEAVRAVGGWVVLIDRAGVGAVNAHVSDRGIASELVDLTITNAGTLEEFQAQVSELIADLTQG